MLFLFLLIFCFVAMGDLLGVSRVAPILHDSALNTVLLTGACGFLLWGMVQDEPRPRLTLLALAGFLCGLDLFIAMQSCLAFVVLGLVILLVQAKEIPFQERLISAGCLLVGGGLGVGLFFLMGGYPHEDPWLWHPEQLVRWVIIAVVAAVAQFFLFRFINQKYFEGNYNKAAGLMPAMVIINCIVALLLDGEVEDFRFTALYSMLTIISLAVLVALFGQRRWIWERMLVLVILFLLPLILQLGAEPNYNLGPALFLTGWYGVVLLLAYRLPLPLRGAGMVALLLFTQFQFTYNYLNFPWNNLESRIAQNSEITEPGALHGIRVTDSIYRFFVDSRSMGVSYVIQKESMALAIYQMAGVLYWLDGTAIGLPALQSQGLAQKANCQALTGVTQLHLEQAMILRQDSIPPVFQQCLARHGINPQKYRDVGQIYNPYSRQMVHFLLPPEKDDTP